MPMGSFKLYPRGTIYQFRHTHSIKYHHRHIERNMSLHSTAFRGLNTCLNTSEFNAPSPIIPQILINGVRRDLELLRKGP
ncbi:hypothetical protein EYC80_002547 [Monilinia laxa]|uniref:Uncharacterized protein n=1 Tax=Monilinia laxa TaxID=61186 RepID=A0A5N6K478_MONLA|nr:hypothetical protein EYC80_002547 [Monilinia laxa]